MTDNFPETPESDSPEFTAVCNAMRRTMAEAFVIFCHKQQQYGPGNIALLGPDGVLDRVEKEIGRASCRERV